MNKLAYDIIYDIKREPHMISCLIACDIISFRPQHSHSGEAALKHWRHPLAACLVLMGYLMYIVPLLNLYYKSVG